MMNSCYKNEIDCLIYELIRQYDLEEHDIDDLAYETVNEALDRSTLKELLVEQTEAMIEELRKQEQEEKKRKEAQRKAGVVIK